MKPNFFPILTAIALFSAASARAEDAKAKQDELEAKFRDAMTAVTMSGRWTPLKDGVLGAEKEDKYTIVSVEKSGGDSWVVHARLHYKKLDIVVPVPVQVKWAGDTAVIIVDHMVVPGPGYGGNAYSARVLIHEGTYAGTWSGGDHGGLMSGVITKDNAKDGPAGPAPK
jgi:hypothetical protein